MSRVVVSLETFEHGGRRAVRSAVFELPEGALLHRLTLRAADDLALLVAVPLTVSEFLNGADEDDEDQADDDD